MSWLAQYLNYTEWHEAPDMFHLWTAISTISSVLERNVWIDMEHYIVYPNLYVILLGKSGLRKSSAIKQGHSLLECVPDRLILMEKITHAKLLVELAERCKRKIDIEMSAKDLDKESAIAQMLTGAASSIIAPELTVFIGKDAYYSGLIATLTSLFDCHDTWPYMTKSFGQFYLYKTCINLCGATTPSGFREVVPPDAVGLGFAARLIPVVGTRKRKRPLFAKEELRIKRRELRDNLVPGLLRMSEMRGPMDLAQDAQEMMEEWYDTKEQVFDDRLESFEEREHALVFKLGMVFAAANGCTYTISKEHIASAIKATEVIKQTMEKAYEHVGEHAYVGHQDRVLRQIQHAGMIPWSNLLSKNWNRIDRRSLVDIVESLEQRKLVRFVRGPKGGKFIAAIDPALAGKEDDFPFLEEEKKKGDDKNA